MTPDAGALLYVCSQFPGSHVCDGPVSEMMLWLSREHSAYQARHRRQGHQRFGQRYATLVEEYGTGWTFAEIAAESWPWQRNESLNSLAWEMYKCWRQSAGHWSVASVIHDLWGGAMKMGNSGIWYTTIIVGDKR